LTVNVSLSAIANERFNSIAGAVKMNRSKHSRRAEVELSPAEREAAFIKAHRERAIKAQAEHEAHEAAVKAQAEAEAKVREAELEKAADEHEAEKARAAEQLLTVHEFTLMPPMMSELELDSLAASITKIGQLHPIIYDSDGKLVDGRCRLEACRRAGIAPKTITLSPDEDPFEVWWSHNIVRGNLNLGQRAMGISIGYPKAALSELVTDAGVSRAIMFEAVYVRDNDPQLVSLVMSGGLAVRDAYDRTKKRLDQAKERAEALRMLEREAPDLSDAIKDERINLEQAIKAFKARTTKQKALREAEKRVRELRESSAAA
jgi:hypothetical protein